MCSKPSLTVGTSRARQKLTNEAANSTNYARNAGQPGDTDSEFLAQKSNTIPLVDQPTIRLFQNLQNVFDANTEHARKAGESSTGELVEDGGSNSIGCCVITRGRKSPAGTRATANYSGQTTFVSSEQ